MKFHCYVAVLVMVQWYLSMVYDDEGNDADDDADDAGDDAEASGLLSADSAEALDAELFAGLSTSAAEGSIRNLPEATFAAVRKPTPDMQGLTSHRLAQDIFVLEWKNNS